MERIKLSKSEKQVLRMVASGLHQCPDEYPSHTFSAAVRVLKGKELVTAHFREGVGCLMCVQRIMASSIWQNIPTYATLSTGV